MFKRWIKGLFSTKVNAEEVPISWDYFCFQVNLVLHFKAIVDNYEDCCLLKTFLLV